jgi:glutathione S-transferase
VSGKGLVCPKDCVFVAKFPSHTSNTSSVRVSELGFLLVVPGAAAAYQGHNRGWRLYCVMDEHLSKSKPGYLVGDKCTIADLACWGWVAAGCECP